MVLKTALKLERKVLSKNGLSLALLYIKHLFGKLSMAELTKKSHILTQDEITSKIQM